MRGALAMGMLSASATTLRIDFGPNDGANGNITASPDLNGSFWNNVFSANVVAAGLTVSNLRTIDDTPTGIGVTMVSDTWRTNGIQNGGLLSPGVALLGEFAIATATQDYFFINGVSTTATLDVKGLNPSRLYTFKLFGSRNTTDVRRTAYTATGSNGAISTTLQTSGPGIGAGGYNGNNDTIATLENVQPTTTGTIQLRMSVAEGTFAYLGILEIVEGDRAPLPTVTNVIDRWVTQDAVDPVAPGAVLFLGSSSIRRWEPLMRDFSDYRILQRGFGGSQLSDVNSAASAIVLPYAPSAIVMWAGTNDIRDGKSAATVLSDFRTFVGIVRTQHPATHVFYLSVTPTPNSAFIDTTRRQLNQLISAECAADPTLHFIDLASFFENLQATTPAMFDSLYVDGLHLNKAGYEEWRRIVRPALDAVLLPDKPAAANPDTLQAGERLLFDFGPSDTTNGDHTLTPDANGNRWNNWHGTNGGGLINSGERVTNLVDITGRETGIRITVTGGFLCNGKLSGGLLNPNPALLGDLAVPSATQDYFFSTADDMVGGGDDNVPGGFMLDGLDPVLSYTFRFFGSRDATETRITEFDVRGANRRTATLRTSGTGIGAGGTNTNNNTIATVPSIQPDCFGQIFVDMTLVQGSFAYLNAMEVVASVPATGIAAWRETWFSEAELADPSLEATLWGPDADPDGDGRTNLEEYAADTNPRASDADPTLWAVESGIDENFLTLTYRKSLPSSDVTAVAEVSEDLAIWTPVESALLSTTGAFEVRKASVPMAGYPRRILRLRYLFNAGAAAAAVPSGIEEPPAPALRIAGKKVRATNQPKIRLKGRLSGAGATIQMKTGGDRYRILAGTKTWSVDMKLRRGTNAIFVRSLDANGTVTSVEKITVRRK